uniref:CCHC-type domain-containing protein n=1 Tax=Cannabis sativa TaxID=3483 RepID=A0A803Q6S7_CANSA
MGNAKFDLEKFTGKNDFGLWRVKMRAMLVQQGLQDALLGESKLSATLSEKEKTEILEKAHSAIILSLGDRVLREVSKETTAAGMWLKLENLYMVKSLANRLFLKQKLYSFRMIPGKSVEDHLDDFNKIVLDLENIGIKIEDEDQAIIVLNSLPSEQYEHFVDTMMYGKSSLTLEEVVTALMSKEIKRKSENSEENAGDGLLVRGKFQKKGNKAQGSPSKGKGNSKTKRRCYVCNKPTHLRKDCPILKSYNSKKDGDAGVVSDGDDSDGYDSASVLVITKNDRDKVWIIDSGCSFHICPDKSQFSNYQSRNSGTVKLGDNHSCSIQGIGTIKLQLDNGKVVELKQVRHVPDLKRNLISVAMLDHEGFKVKIEKGLLKVIKGSEKLMEASIDNGIYVLQGCIKRNQANSVLKVPDDVTLKWHRRLGHISHGGLKVLSKKGVFGKEQIKELDLCEECIMGKATKAKFGVGKHKTRNIVDYLHSDLWGPSRTQSRGGARCMLIYAGLPKKFWAEAAVTACYLINISPSSAIEFKTPIEVWTGSNSSYDHLRIFGCLAYAHIKQGKLEPRARKCIFLGYPEGVKGYKVWSIEDGNHQKNFISRDVVFDEKVMYKDLMNVQDGNAAARTGNATAKNSEERTQFEVEMEPDQENTEGNEIPTTEPGYEESQEEMSDHEPEASDYMLVRDRKRRAVKPPDRFGYADVVHFALSIDGIEGEEPCSYEEAMQSDDKKEWDNAMDQEMDSLKKNKTWIVIRRPAGQRAIGNKWVYKHKDGIPGVEGARFKARLVAKDVKIAFLHGELDEQILMKQPKGYEIEGKEDHVCLLKRSLYGLKQSPRQWYKSKSIGEINKVKKMLNQEFEMKDLGPARKILGMEITRNREHHVPNGLRQDTISLLWSMVSRFMGQPGKDHWTVVKWIMRYLKGTQTTGLIYGANCNGEEVRGFVDSDYAGDIDTRRSQSGYVFQLNGCTISWKSNLQSIVALSTTEAEYIACTEAIKEALWLKGITAEVGINQREIPVMCDSQSALHLSRNQVFHERTKHIDVRMHFIRDVISGGKIKLLKVSNDDNAADVLTKSLPTAKFSKCLEILNVSSTNTD